MSGTKSPSQKAPATKTGWSRRKLAVILYPFTAAAVAINLFMFGLMWQVFGWPALSPVATLIWSIPLGVPATILVARWVRGLMDEADG